VTNNEWTGMSAIFFDWLSCQNYPSTERCGCLRRSTTYEWFHLASPIRMRMLVVLKSFEIFSFVTMRNYPTWNRTKCWSLCLTARSIQNPTIKDLTNCPTGVQKCLRLNVRYGTRYVPQLFSNLDGRYLVTRTLTAFVAG